MSWSSWALQSLSKVGKHRRHLHVTSEFIGTRRRRCYRRSANCFHNGQNCSKSVGVIERKIGDAKVGFLVQCIKKQLTPLQNFNIQTCFSQFLWVFSLNVDLGQMVSWIHLSLPNACKLMCFDINISEIRNVKLLECVQLCVKPPISSFDNHD